MALQTSTTPWPGSRTRLAPEPDARASLAAAIARCAALTRDIATNQEQSQQAEAAVFAAQSRLEKARQIAEKQSRAHTVADIKTALQDARNARLSLEQIEEELEHLRSLRDRLAAEASRLSDQLEYGQRSVRSAIANVAAETALALAAQYRETIYTLRDLAATITLISNYGRLPEAARSWAAEPLPRRHDPDPRVQAWLTALETDSEAVLEGDE